MVLQMNISMGVLRQALRGNPDKRLIAVTWLGGTKSDADKQRDFEHFILKQLDLADTDGKVVVRIATAKKFLGEELSLATVSKYFPEKESLFQEIQTSASTADAEEVALS